MSKKLDLLQGTLDVMVLKVLSLAPEHGYGIARWIRERSDGQILVEDRALYVALHRMQKRGWIDAQWKTTENRRRAKVYHLTDAGIEALRDRSRDWTRYADAVFSILQAE